MLEAIQGFKDVITIINATFWFSLVAVIAVLYIAVKVHGIRSSCQRIESLLIEVHESKRAETSEEEDSERLANLIKMRKARPQELQ